MSLIYGLILIAIYGSYIVSFFWSIGFVFKVISDYGSNDLIDSSNDFIDHYDGFQPICYYMIYLFVNSSCVLLLFNYLKNSEVGILALVAVDLTCVGILFFSYIIVSKFFEDNSEMKLFNIFFFLVIIFCYFYLISFIYEINTIFNTRYKFLIWWLLIPVIWIPSLFIICFKNKVILFNLMLTTTILINIFLFMLEIKPISPFNFLIILSISGGISFTLLLILYFIYEPYLIFINDNESFNSDKFIVNTATFSILYEEYKNLLLLSILLFINTYHLTSIYKHSWYSSHTELIIMFSFLCLLEIALSIYLINFLKYFSIKIKRLEEPKKIKKYFKDKIGEELHIQHDDNLKIINYETKNIESVIKKDDLEIASLLSDKCINFIPKLNMYIVNKSLENYELKVKLKKYCDKNYFHFFDPYVIQDKSSSSKNIIDFIYFGKEDNDLKWFLKRDNILNFFNSIKPYKKLLNENYYKLLKCFLERNYNYKIETANNYIILPLNNTLEKFRFDNNFPANINNDDEILIKELLFFMPYKLDYILLILKTITDNLRTAYHLEYFSNTINHCLSIDYQKYSYNDVVDSLFFSKDYPFEFEILIPQFISMLKNSYYQKEYLIGHSLNCLIEMIKKIKYEKIRSIFLSQENSFESYYLLAKIIKEYFPSYYDSLKDEWRSELFILTKNLSNGNNETLTSLMFQTFIVIEQESKKYE